MHLIYHVSANDLFSHILNYRSLNCEQMLSLQKLVKVKYVTCKFEWQLYVNCEWSCPNAYAVTLCCFLHFCMNEPCYSNPLQPIFRLHHVLDGMQIHQGNFGGCPPIGSLCCGVCKNG